MRNPLKYLRLLLLLAAPLFYSGCYDDDYYYAPPPPVFNPIEYYYYYGGEGTTGLFGACEVIINPDYYYLYSEYYEIYFPGFYPARLEAGPYLRVVYPYLLPGLYDFTIYVGCYYFDAWGNPYYDGCYEQNLYGTADIYPGQTTQVYAYPIRY